MLVGWLCVQLLHLRLRGANVGESEVKKRWSGSRASEIEEEQQEEHVNQKEAAAAAQAAC